MLERSCGTVLFKVIDGTVHYLLIKSAKSGFCGLPKGHMENDENEEQTAYRETWEETSVKPDFIKGFRTQTQYNLKNGNTKNVVFFLADYTGQEPAHNEGFENLLYLSLPYEEAYEALSLVKMKTVLSEANDFVVANILNK